MNAEVISSLDEDKGLALLSWLSSPSLTAVGHLNTAPHGVLEYHAGYSCPVTKIHAGQYLTLTLPSLPAYRAQDETLQVLILHCLSLATLSSGELPF